MHALEITRWKVIEWRVTTFVRVFTISYAYTTHCSVYLGQSGNCPADTLHEMSIKVCCCVDISTTHGWVALLVARRTNDRKVAGSRLTKVVYITVLTGNRIGWTARCGRPPLLLPSCRKLEFGPSALMDSDLAWVNGKSGRQSWS